VLALVDRFDEHHPHDPPLEASNAANVPLYRRYGYEPRDVFSVPGSPDVTTMWRDARA
jgi:hypothetical protein